MRTVLTIVTALALLPALAAADAGVPNRKTTGGTELTDQQLVQPQLRPSTTAEALKVEEAESDLQNTNQAPLYFLNWWSVNGGGDVAAASASYEMGLSVGQGAAGTASSANYNMGIGFWYGIAGAGGGGCPIVMTGDANDDGSITSADIIYLVNYVFKGGAAPILCAAVGDANCDGSVTSADIIYLVGYVFKGGPAPCDACTLIPGTWTCP